MYGNLQSSHIFHVMLNEYEGDQQWHFNSPIFVFGLLSISRGTRSVVVSSEQPIYSEGEAMMFLGSAVAGVQEMQSAEIFSLAF